MSGRRKSQEAEGSGNRGSGVHESSSRKRKQSQEHDSRARYSKKYRSRSPSEASGHRKHHKHYHKGKRSQRSSHYTSVKEDRNYKIDQIFEWVKSSATHSRKSRERSASRTSTRESGSEYTRRRSYSNTRSLASGNRREHDISFEASSVRSVVVPVGNSQKQSDVPAPTREENVDSLTARLNALRAEGLPKPITGPAISEELAPILNGVLNKSEFVKTMKLCDKYPRPANIDQLNIPELCKDASKIIDQKAVKNDDRFKNDQKCTSALFGALGKSLDVVLKFKEQIPELLEVGDMLLDSLQFTGFLHQDFTNIRLKGFKQTVNPSYEDVVSHKPDEPDMLLGKTPLGEQMKSCDELSKLKAKFKKPDQSAHTSTKKDFRRGGEYRKKPFNRDFKSRGRKNVREDRRTGYYSPKGNFRRGQQEYAQKQEDKKNPHFRKN